MGEVGIRTYSALDFVKYELMYLNVSARTYVHLCTGYVHTYVQDTSLYVYDTDMSVSYTDMSVSHMYSKYLTVFACICTYFGKWLLAPAASAHILARVRLRAGAWSLQFACAQARGRRAVPAAFSSCGQHRCRQIINRFIWIRPARLDSSSRRQLEQQR